MRIVSEVKKIKEKEIQKHLDKGYNVFISKDSINYFKTEKSLLKRLKKHKGKSVYTELKTGYFIAYVKE